MNDQFDIYEPMRCKHHTKPRPPQPDNLPARFLDGVLIAFSICALLLLVSWMQERDLEAETLTPRTTLAHR